MQTIRLMFTLNASFLIEMSRHVTQAFNKIKQFPFGEEVNLKCAKVDRSSLTSEEGRPPRFAFVKVVMRMVLFLDKGNYFWMVVLVSIKTEYVCCLTYFTNQLTHCLQLLLLFIAKS